MFLILIFLISLILQMESIDYRKLNNWIQNKENFYMTL